MGDKVRKPLGGWILKYFIFLFDSEKPIGGIHDLASGPIEEPKEAQEYVRDAILDRFSNYDSAQIVRLDADGKLRCVRRADRRKPFYEIFWYDGAGKPLKIPEQIAALDADMRDVTEQFEELIELQEMRKSTIRHYKNESGKDNLE